jgi:hypothetical protein
MVPIDLILDAFARLKTSMSGDESSNALRALRDGFAGSLPESAAEHGGSSPISGLSGL